MYPVSTSFIPVTVSLSKYIIEGGNIWGNYPYWYFGSTPFRFLTGPVVPGILVRLHKVFPALTFFDLSYFLIFASLLVGACGWGFLAAGLSGRKLYGYVVGLLVLILPWRFVSAMALGEVSAILAGALTPWILLSFARLLNFSSNSLVTSKRHILNLLLPALAFGLLLMVNTTASVGAVIGLLIIGFVAWGKWEDGLKSAALVIAGGWILTLWWYGLGFWLAILGAPSIGGRSVMGVFAELISFARTILPVILAVVFVFWKAKPKTVFEKFSLFWLSTFGALTLFRLVSDAFFWIDWTAWMGEMEVGVVLVAGVLTLGSLANFKTASNSFRILVLFITLYFFAGWGLVFAHKGFWMPRKNVENTIEYRVAKKLEGTAGPGETVFLSGTTAFWLNSLADIRQVRGGRDEVSKSNDWRSLVWEARMGASGQKAVEALNGLGVAYLVVHTDASGEFYHDFKNQGKFEGLDSLVKVYDENGDIIYRVR